jgi:hypothetical protein
MLQMNALLEAQREAMYQLLPALIHQQNAEHLVVDNPV